MRNFLCHKKLFLYDIINNHIRKAHLFYCQKTFPNAKKTAYLHRLFFNQNGNVLLSRAVSRQVSSALRSLTSVFGMGTGVSSSLSSPHQACFAHSKLNNLCVSPFPSLKPWSSLRPISTFQLNALLHLHPRPIYVIVSHGSYHLWRRSLLVGGFVLRCFQHLSRPYVATQLCPWQNNWCTRGMSIPVLSY